MTLNWASRLGLVLLVPVLSMFSSVTPTSLTPGEIDLFARQLSDFLGYATEVLAIDTAGVAPTAYLGSGRTSDRLDEVRTSLDREAASDRAAES